ncbi:MAG: RecX family transcriptional regulator [Parachlamydiaceae bacterium]|nr:RecX family transcriptional regulator [Parachlamydiaceae bacterium]
MKLEILPKREQKDVFTIFVDEELWKDIHSAIFGKKLKFSVIFTTIEELQAYFNQLEYKLAKNYVLRRLSMQSYFSKQLEKLLKDRLIQSETRKRLIEECVDWGYLNDDAWLESFVRVHIKQHSMRTISMKLRSKGVSQEILGELFSKWNDPEREKEKLQHLLDTRYRKKDLTNFKEKQKVIASLARKGYSFELIQSVLLE